MFDAKDFNLATFLTPSHKFLYIVYSFLFNMKDFLMFLETDTPSVTHGLHRTMLFSFKMFEHFAVIFLELVSISVLLSSENIRIMIFSYFKVDKNYFMYKDICYLSDCLLCTWNKCIFCFWLGCPIKAKWTQLVDSVVQIFYISLTLFTCFTN